MRYIDKETFKELEVIRENMLIGNHLDSYKQLNKITQDKQLVITDVGSTFVCNYCLEKTDTLPDNFGCQSCIDNYK